MGIAPTQSWFKGPLGGHGEWQLAHGFTFDGTDAVLVDYLDYH